ncbi:ABC transporter permease [Streptosporangium sp. NBC_01756]|uniref:ABC transporter permease n=1 Tax=Streptosporangium sp. NBC_01756 TaxID=2975950 RepID=UPI002DD93BC0|nr:ABC transporter permease [Streptosporangium sp. NBC_01756]WSC90105.1 ABC transporter permease [Streptosporangium sp. NBC_01756]
MTAFLGRRLAQALLQIWGAVTIVFIALRVLPGDPAELILGSQATPEQLKELRAELGLGEPLPAQYLHHLQDVVRLDFGQSWRQGVGALDACLERLGSTLTLSAWAMVLTIVLGFLAGSFAARHANTVADHLVSVSSLVGQALPPFWIGIMLSLIFARWLQILPSTADGTMASLLLPALTLALPFVGWLGRLVRTGILEEMNQDYVRTARAKGLSSRVVFYVHVLRNTLVPVVTMLGLLMGYFIANGVIVEVIFAWPGIGSLLVDSITFRDYAVVEAILTVITVCYITLNLLVDVLYAYLDPRIQLENA